MELNLQAFERALLEREFRRCVDPAQNARVLNIGNGISSLPAPVASFQVQLHIPGLSVSGNPAGRVVTGAQERLPFGSACFDAAIGVFALEHAKDASGALQEVWRVLKNGGTLLLLTRFCAPLGDERWRFTRYALEEWLRRFRTVEVTETSGYLAALSKMAAEGRTPNSIGRSFLLALHERLALPLDRGLLRISRSYGLFSQFYRSLPQSYLSVAKK